MCGLNKESLAGDTSESSMGTKGIDVEDAFSCFVIACRT